ncbi:SgcJ/EcaC family oxidoreductase [Virgibacillus siamensis]|uniref:SgcJ/EcaC family oxidoreductase n=1 Tax=Virgibacillus siamensis TaxID=480071 RepID=UPI001FE688FB|nr:SgcJ/EcaC family oxidoreductase [Virgibacillus siamensis]
MNDTMREEVIALYNRLIKSWNSRDAEGMAADFSEDGIQIGFDGSKVVGQAEIQAHVAPIFDTHPTPPFITKIKGVRQLGSDAAVIDAIAGMVPPGKSDIDPSVNAQQTMTAVKHEGVWRIALFQNTPAQFHGRQGLVDEMTEELREVYQNS